ncbi:MAG: DUF4398 domain-containing protein [Burkholderiaceae bacterium]|nr:DUF4398 domain-containing protein [Burkholderiaceae bacterium]
MKTLILATLVASGALALTGCANAPSPAPSMASTSASIEAARSAGAPELAAAELNEARSKLERARALAAAGDERGAIRLAEQADVDAQLARARAGSERSIRAVTELEASLQTLREEINRAAAKQPANPSK